MNPHRLPGPQRSLLQRLVATVVGGTVLVALFFVGLFAWILIAGVALVAGVGFSIWLWRQKRRMEDLRARHGEALRRQAAEKTRAGTDSIIEGEYIVVTERRRSGKTD